jgi:hypothetical protein
MDWKPIIKKLQLKKEILNCRKPPPKLPAHLEKEAFYTLTRAFCSIKLKEEILLMNISE